MALTRVASDMYLNTEQILLLRDRTEGAAGSLTIRLVDGYELKLPVSACSSWGSPMVTTSPLTNRQLRA